MKPIKLEIQKIVTQYIHMKINILIYLTFYRVVKQLIEDLFTLFYG